MMENETNYSQFASRRADLSAQDVQAFGRNAVPLNGDTSSREFVTYTGGGERIVPQTIADRSGSNVQTQITRAPQKRTLPRSMISTAIVAAIVVVAIFGVIRPTRKPAVDTGQLLKNGIACLDNGQYEKALEQFSAVIDIDPKAMEAPYIGAADAYIGLNRPDRAVRILEKGYRNTNSSIIQRRLDELAASTASLNENGNTNGNLSNDALVAVQGEWVFYIVDGVLYKAKTGGTQETRLIDGAYRVNVVGDWVYFVKNDNIYKIKTDGMEETLISEDFVRSSPLAVVGDWIYYATVQPYDSYADRSVAEAMSMATGEYGIYRIRKDGSERTQLNSLICHSLNVEGDWLYCLDMNDSIWKIRTDGTEATQLGKEPCWSINVDSDWIYYVRRSDNGIYKMRTDGSRNTRISGDCANFINVSDGWLYYSDPAFADDVIGEKIGLYKMRPDGSEKTQLTNDRALAPNIAGEWIYYLSFADESGLIFNKVRTDGKDGQRIN